MTTFPYRRIESDAQPVCAPPAAPIPLPPRLHAPRPVRRAIVDASRGVAVVRFVEESPPKPLALKTDEPAAPRPSADFNTLCEMLRRRELLPNDLVYSDGRWWTFRDAPDFTSVCLGLRDWRGLKAHLAWFATALKQARWQILIAVALGVARALCRVLIPLFVR